MASVRLFLSLAATHQWPLHQLDVTNAFLHGDLSEEVYMEQPPGFIAKGEEQHVCRLQRSLYGLKQSPRAWFGRFSSVVCQFGLHQSQKDHSVFYRLTPDGWVLLVVYVDDIVITGSDTRGIAALKVFLNQHFQTKDLGQLRYFLGIEVARGKKGIFISQRKYTLDTLQDAGLFYAKGITSPMDPGIKLLPDEGELFSDPEQYRRTVGKLNYLTTMTRPDIAYAVRIVSQFLIQPRVPHWDAVMRILRYLQSSPGKGIQYRARGHSRLEAFADADWAGCPVSRRSTTGYLVFVGGNLISWKSKKQDIVARSSAESEYRAMAHATCEIMWTHQILTELGFEVNGPTTLWCDNKSAIHITENSVFHERTKHIEIDCHTIRDEYLKGTISLHHVGTDEQLADLLTKPLAGTRVGYLSDKLDMTDIYVPA